MKICLAFRIQSVKLTYHIGLSIQQETKKQGQNDCYEKGTCSTLYVGWEDSEFIHEGFILKLLLAGETLNSFLLDGISKHFLFQTDWWKSVQPIEHKVYTELIKLASLFKTKKKRTILLLWERERLHFGFWLEIHLTLSWRIDFPTAIGWEDIQFLPTDGIKIGHKIYKMDGVAPSFRT